MRWYVVVICILFFYESVFSQKIGVIIQTEADTAYIDLTKPDIQIGDKLVIEQDGGYMIHPVTKEKIEKGKEKIGYLQITDLKEKYSIGKIIPPKIAEKVSAGMYVKKLSIEEIALNKELKDIIAISSINLIGYEKSSAGDYMSDLLAHELRQKTTMRLVDRQSLDMQIKEAALNLSGVLDEYSAINVGKILGVKYFVLCSGYPPEVKQKSSGLPIKSLLSTAEALTNTDLNSEKFSNIKKEKLEGEIQITARVVDVATGEIIFTAVESATYEGESNIAFEGGLFSNVQTNQGATLFTQTVSGKVSQLVMSYIADDINSYFNGTIKTKLYKRIGNKENSSLKIIRIDKEVNKKGKIKYSAILNQGKLSNFGYDRNGYDIYQLQYKKSDLNGEMVSDGKKRVGTLYIDVIEDNVSRAELDLSDYGLKLYTENPNILIDDPNIFIKI